MAENPTTPYIDLSALDLTDGGMTREQADALVVHDVPTDPVTLAAWKAAFEAQVARQEAAFWAAVAGQIPIPDYQVTVGRNGEFAVLMPTGITRSQESAIAGDVRRRFETTSPNEDPFPGMRVDTPPDYVSPPQSHGPDEFQCAKCGGIFTKRWTDLEAAAETAMRFGDLPTDEQATVCDDCYTALIGWAKSQGLVP
jgi:hypothetical protein